MVEDNRQGWVVIGSVDLDLNGLQPSASLLGCHSVVDPLLTLFDDQLVVSLAGTSSVGVRSVQLAPDLAVVASCPSEVHKWTGAWGKEAVQLVEAQNKCCCTPAVAEDGLPAGIGSSAWRRQIVRHSVAEHGLVLLALLVPLSVYSSLLRVVAVGLQVEVVCWTVT